MSLKPQDIVIALKLCGYLKFNRPTYAEIGAELVMSPSEVHAGVKRLKTSRLLQSYKEFEEPNLSALEEYLIHGVKYSFPAVRGSITRGIPTSYAAEPLRNLISSGNEPPPIWAYAKGTVRGIAITPLYKTVPAAAQRDSLLYKRLALVDAIRDGRARERNFAIEELKNSLKATYE